VLWLERLARRDRFGKGVRAGLWAWGAAIVVSTLGIKQHVVLDVVAGAVLAGVVAWFQLGGRRATRLDPGATAEHG
jgi:membrane-associated phospholipid phosphatase